MILRPRRRHTSSTHVFRNHLDADCSRLRDDGKLFLSLWVVYPQNMLSKNGTVGAELGGVFRTCTGWQYFHIAGIATHTLAWPRDPIPQTPPREFSPAKYHPLPW